MTVRPLILRIDVDDRGRPKIQALDGSLGNLNRRLDQASARAQRFGGAMRTMAGIAGIGSAAIALRSLAREVIGFEQAMSRVQAVTQATSQRMDQMARVARDLGGTTVFTAQQAAEGMTFLGMAGFETNEIIEAMPGVLNLAAAGQISLAESADIASNVLSGFRMEAAETGRVVDVLAALQASANTNIIEAGEAMSYAAPVAATWGTSLEEAGAAIGILANNAIKGSRGGTALTQMYARLADVQDDARRVLESHGVAMSDIDVAARGLIPVLQTLAEANLSASDMTQIFGQRTMTAASVLVSSVNDLKDYAEELNHVEGTSERMAETMQNNVAGAFRRLGSAVAELGHKLYSDTGLKGGVINTTNLFTRLTQAAGAATAAVTRLYGQVGRAGSALGAEIARSQIESRLRSEAENTVAMAEINFRQLARQAGFPSMPLEMGQFDLIEVLERTAPEYRQALIDAADAIVQARADAQHMIDMSLGVLNRHHEQVLAEMFAPDPGIEVIDRANAILQTRIEALADGLKKPLGDASKDMEKFARDYEAMISVITSDIETSMGAQAIQERINLLRVEMDLMDPREALRQRLDAERQILDLRAEQINLAIAEAGDLSAKSDLLRQHEAIQEEIRLHQEMGVLLAERENQRLLERKQHLLETLEIARKLTEEANKYADAIAMAKAEAGGTSVSTFFDTLGGLDTSGMFDFDLQPHMDSMLSAFEDMTKAHNKFTTRLIDREQYMHDRRIAMAQIAATGLSSIATTLTGVLGRESEAAFRINQSMAIVNAIINTAQGVTKALAMLGPFGIPFAAIIGAMGAAQVALIAAQQPPSTSYHEGGYVTGGAGPRRDEVNAVLQTGEGVVSRRGMAALDQINSGVAGGGSQTINLIVEGEVVRSWVLSPRGRQDIHRAMQEEEMLA